MRKGFTLTELIVTIVLLAVLSSIAVPGFSKARDKAAAAQAIAYLRTIRVGEKMYFAKNAVYKACTTKAAINTHLAVEVTEENYKFIVTAADPTTDFVAMAYKASSAPDNCTTTADTICVSKASTSWSGNSSYVNFTTLNS